MNSEQLQQVLDKQQVRRAFSRAASSYDQAAILQREINDRMFSRLDYIKYRPEVILDAGSGTGYGTRQLTERYPDSRILALDIAWQMLNFARPQTNWLQRLNPLNKQKNHYVCADIEQFPLAPASVGMVWSNLALQWCNNLEQTIREIHRVLQIDGLFMFSTFGPDTLKELRQAFNHADGFSHVNRFVDMHDIGDILVHTGFATPVMDMEYITLTYDDVINVMRDLKAIGAHNVTEGRRRGLMGKTAWQKAVDYYESLRQDGSLPATFEVIYGHAWRPESRRDVLTPEIRRELGLIP